MGVRCDFTFKYVDAILKRNWFLDMEGIHDMLAELPEDVYYEVLEHRNEYHPDIRWALEEPEIPSRFLRMEVRDVSEEEWLDMEEKKEREHRSLMTEKWKDFVPPPRPRSEIDELMDGSNARIETAKQTLDKLLAEAKKTQRYIVGSRRGEMGADTPAITAARERLASAENGFVKTKELFDSINKKWRELMLCDAMLQDAVRRRSSRTVARAPTPSA